MICISFSCSSELLNCYLSSHFRQRALVAFIQSHICSYSVNMFIFTFITISIFGLHSMPEGKDKCPLPQSFPLPHPLLSLPSDKNLVLRWCWWGVKWADDAVDSLCRVPRQWIFGHRDLCTSSSEFTNYMVSLTLPDWGGTSHHKVINICKYTLVANTKAYLTLEDVKFSRWAGRAEPAPGESQHVLFCNMHWDGSCSGHYASGEKVFDISDFRKHSLQLCQRAIWTKEPAGFLLSFELNKGHSGAEEVVLQGRMIPFSNKLSMFPAQIY